MSEMSQPAMRGQEDRDDDQELRLNDADDLAVRARENLMRAAMTLRQAIESEQRAASGSGAGVEMAEMEVGRSGVLIEGQVETFTQVQLSRPGESRAEAVARADEAAFRRGVASRPDNTPDVDEAAEERRERERTARGPEITAG